MMDLEKISPPAKPVAKRIGLLRRHSEANFQETNHSEGEPMNERLPIDRESLMTHSVAAVLGFAVSMLFYLNGGDAVLNTTAMVVMFCSGVLSGGFIAMRYFKIRLKHLNLWRKP